MDATGKLKSGLLLALLTEMAHVPWDTPWNCMLGWSPAAGAGAVYVLFVIVS